MHCYNGQTPVKLAGMMLLVAGWGIVVAALVLLRTEASRGAFTVAGVLVEALGLTVFARGHMGPRGDGR
jgi:hypothetical protein